MTASRPRKLAETAKRVFEALRHSAVQCGRGFGRRFSWRIVEFCHSFVEPQIVATLWRQLGWAHFKLPIPIQIRVQPDRLWIWNNGPLPPSWTAQTLREQHISQPANPDIASTFFRASLIEAWGRGYERIAEACRDAGTPEPTVQCDCNGVWVKWAWANPESDAETPSAMVQVTEQVGVQVREQVREQGSGHPGGREAPPQRKPSGCGRH